MAVDLPAIRQRLIVDTSALDQVPGAFRKVGGALGKAVAGGAVVAGAAVGAFAANGIREATNVDRGLREVVTLFGETGDAAGDLATELGDGVAKLSDNVKIAQDELVGGLYQAISAGVPKDNAFDFLEVASKASIAGVTDVETSIDGLTTTINAFGLDVDQAGAVADSMFAAVQGGKTTFEELSSSLFQVAPSAAAAGIGFEEVNAGIATLTAQGVPTSVATTRMRAAIDELAKPGTKVGEVFEKVAGKSFREFIAEGGNLQGALELLQGSAEESGVKIGDYFGSIEAAGAATALAETGAAKYAEELERQANAAGSTADAYDTMNASTDRTLEGLKVTVSNLGQELGRKALPALTELARWATENLPAAVDAAVEAFGRFRSAVETAIGFVQRFRTPILAVATVLLASYVPALVTAAQLTVVNTAKKIGAWALLRLEALKSIGAVIVGIGRIIAQTVAATAAVVAQVARQVAAWVLLGVQSLIQAAKVAAAWLIAMGPIAIVIAAVVGLVALIVANWDTIKRVTLELWDKVKSFTTEAWDKIKTAIRNAWESVKSATTTAISAVVGWLRELPGRIVNALTGLATTVLGFIREYHPAAVLFRAVRDYLPTLIGLITEIPSRIVRGLGRIGSLLYSSGRDLINGLLRGIKAVASRIADAVVAPIRGAVDKAKRFLRIGSPSRLMADMGRDTGEGFALGIEDKQKRAALAARAIAKSAADVAASATLPTPGAPGGYSKYDRAANRQAADRAAQVNYIDVKAWNVREAARELGDTLTFQGKLLTVPR